MSSCCASSQRAVNFTPGCFAISVWITHTVNCRATIRDPGALSVLGLQLYRLLVNDRTEIHVYCRHYFGSAAASSPHGVMCSTSLFSNPGTIDRDNALAYGTDERRSAHNFWVSALSASEGARHNRSRSLLSGGRCHAG